MLLSNVFINESKGSIKKSGILVLSNNQPIHGAATTMEQQIGGIINSFNSIFTQFISLSSQFPRPPQPTMQKTQ